MKRRIRFPLKMAHGAEVKNLQELRENFSLRQMRSYLENGKLVIWLQNLYENDLADAVEALDVTDEKIEEKLCGIFDVQYEKVKAIEEDDIVEEKTALISDEADGEKNKRETEEDSPFEVLEDQENPIVVDSGVSKGFTNNLPRNGGAVSWHVEPFMPKRISKLYYTDRDRYDSKRLAQRSFGGFWSICHVFAYLSGKEGLYSEDSADYLKETANVICKELGISYMYPDVDTDKTVKDFSIDGPSDRYILHKEMFYEAFKLFPIEELRPVLF